MTFFERKVEACKIFRELHRVVRRVDEANVPGQKGIYCSLNRFMSAQKLNAVIYNVKAGRLPIVFVTRNYGLRHKVQSLLDSNNMSGLQS